MLKTKEDACNPNVLETDRLICQEKMKQPLVE